MAGKQRPDPVNFIACCIGVAILFELWRRDILTAGTIWKILTADI